VLDGFWCFNGKKSYILVNASPVVFDQMNASGVRPPFLEESMTDGQFYIRGGIDIPIGNFYRLGDQKVPGSFACPLNFFQVDFDPHLSRSTEPGYAKSRWAEKTDPTSGLFVEFAAPSPEDTTSFIFDPERGYLPIFQRNHTTTGQLHYEKWITDAKQLPSGQWVPLIWVFIQYFPKIKETRLYTLEITEIDPITPPTDDQFNVDLSRFAQVTERGHPFRIYHPHEGEILSVNHMERFAEKLVAVGKEREISESEHSDQFVASNGQSNRWRLVWLAIGLLVPLLTFGIIRWWRTRHARGATSNGDAGSTQGM